MAVFNINPNAIGQTLANTAMGKIAQKAGQAMSPKMVQDVQRVLNVGRLIGQYTGLQTGIGLVDNLLGLGGGRDEALALFGGLSQRQAQELMSQQHLANLARKNLFFIRITDDSPPVGVYSDPVSSESLGRSQIGAGIDEVSRGIAGAAASIGGAKVGAALGSFVSTAANSAASAVAASLGLGGGSSANSIAGIAINSFDMLALDVSYGPSIASDHQSIGSTFFDKPTGLNPLEMQITTMDDEVGSIKRWFEGKMMQVAHPDGTMGLPAEYLFTVEVVHAIASPDVENEHLAYRKVSRVRASAAQFDLSRRDQALSECQLTLTQFDPFLR